MTELQPIPESLIEELEASIEKSYGFQHKLLAELREINEQNMRLAYGAEQRASQQDYTNSIRL